MVDEEEFPCWKGVHIGKGKAGEGVRNGRVRERESRGSEKDSYKDLKLLSSPISLTTMKITESQ